MKLTRSEAWESSFFGFPIEELKIGKSELTVDQVTAQLADLVDCIQEDTLLKVAVDASQLHAIPWLERQGFELWETRFCGSRPGHENNCGKTFAQTPLSGDRMVWARESHHEAILHMTNVHLAKSTAVVNRFDSPFYPEGSAEKWYANWISHVLQNPEALVAVAEHGEQGRWPDISSTCLANQKASPCTKAFCLSSSPSIGDGICVHLQQFLFEEMATRHEQVTLDNTTQVSNYPVIRNHAKSGRRPEQVELIMFRGPHRRL